MPQSNAGTPTPPLWETLKQDWRYVRDEVQPGWRGTFRKTMAELEEFYLTPDERQSLAKMNRVWRWMSLAWRLLKSLFFKLSPVRRAVADQLPVQGILQHRRDVGRQGVL